jgi:hypothetical protein
MAQTEQDPCPVVVVIVELDNLLLHNYWRKYQTMLELGWDIPSIQNYLSKKENLPILPPETPLSNNSPSQAFRDKYLTIYNRDDLLSKDVALEGAVDAVNRIVADAYCVVLSSRPASQQNTTIDLLKFLGYPIHLMEFNFLGSNESTMSFRNRIFSQIQRRFMLGVGICLTPSDAIGFDRLSYPTLGLTTLKNECDLRESFDGICETWGQLEYFISEMKKAIPKQKIEIAQSKLSAKRPKRVQTSVNVSSIASQFDASGGIIMPTTTLPPVTPATPTVPATPAPVCNEPAVNAKMLTDDLMLLSNLLEQDTTLKEADGTLSVFERAEARAQTQVMLDEAIFHQLFSGAGTDRIMGLDENSSLQIENVEELLNSFMAELKPKLFLINATQIGEFFAYFSQRFQLDLTDVQMIVAANLEGMVGLENEENAQLFMVIAKFIEKLRNITFEHFGVGWIAYLFHEIGGMVFEGSPKDKFNQLLNDNDPDIGLLYNVSFILWLIHMYPNTPYSQPIQDVIKNHAVKVIGKLYQ